MAVKLFQFLKFTPNLNKLIFCFLNFCDGKIFSLLNKNLFQQTVF